MRYNDTLMPPIAPQSSRVSICVGGRFHSDQLAWALLQAGYEVSLHTSLPKYRFMDLPNVCFRTHVFSEILYRLGGRFGFGDQADHWKMRALGRSLRADAERSDVLLAWSSFGLEAFRKSAARKVLVRDSSHISFQTQWLGLEYDRLKLKFSPRKFCEQRELEEYSLSDSIWVLSEFAKKSFVQKGVPATKLFIVRLGVNTEYFPRKPTSEIKLPLKAVFFGTVGVRKGVHRLLEATKEFSPEQLELTLIGPVEQGFETILRRYDHFKYQAPLPHVQLGKELQNYDLFVFPTLEDGFGQTLAQAMAVGLVPLTTDHCGAAEGIRNGENGFVVAAGSTAALVERLYALTERPELLESMRQSSTDFSWKGYHDRVRELIERELRSRTPLRRQIVAASALSHG
ncbi:MAG: glycosyltransferase family 4 protein [Bdellovibrionales bacterium]|nr:glycosyltransferase family 4 protein [Bdellovibrionales bacterium]